MSIENFTDNPAPTTCRLIDYEVAEVRGGIVNDTYFLYVSGTVPCMNMKVELMPRIYAKCPDYWGIEVIGCLPGVCLRAVKKFELIIDLAGITGSSGIELFGATKNQKWNVSGGCSDVRATSDDFIPWPGIAGVET